MIYVTIGDNVESIVTVDGTNCVLLDMNESVKEVKNDLKEVKDDGKELKQGLKEFRDEVQLGLRDMQTAVATQPSKKSKLSLLLMFKYSLLKFNCSFAVFK